MALNFAGSLLQRDIAAVLKEATATTLNVLIAFHNFSFGDVRKERNVALLNYLGGFCGRYLRRKLVVYFLNNHFVHFRAHGGNSRGRRK